MAPLVFPAGAKKGGRAPRRMPRIDRAQPQPSLDDLASWLDSRLAEAKGRLNSGCRCAVRVAANAALHCCSMWES